MADLVPVTFAGILMDGATPDDEGVIWGVQSPIDGWDAAPVRVSDEDQTGRHGTFGPARLYGARPLVLSGDAQSPDLATAFRVRDRVAAYFGSGSLVVREPVPKSLEVVQGGIARSSEPMNRAPFWIDWQVSLVARDPFKRALSSTTIAVPAGATVAIPSDGTAAADLRATVTSAGTVQLTAGGLTLTTSSLPVGAVIDTASCTVTGPDGADLYGAVAHASQWPALPAGGGPVKQAGTAALDITYRDTYA